MDHHAGAHIAGTSSPDSKASSPPNDSSKPKIRVVERGSQACNECRRHKIRCHPAPDDPEHVKPCARCVRMSLECVFKKHNRGRKRKNPPQSELLAGHIPLAPAKMAAMESSSAPSSVTRPMHGAAGNAYWNRNSPDRGLFSGVSRYPFMSLEPPTREHDHHGASTSASRDSARPTLPASMSLRSMVHSEPWDGDDGSDAYTDAETDIAAASEIDRHRPSGIDHRPSSRGQPNAPPHATATNGGDASGAFISDPVTAGYLTIDDARALFQLFIQNYNVAMPILDPVVQTHDHVRQSSTFLYTVILCIASRYMNAVPLPDYRPEVNPVENTVHRQIAILARDHIMWAFAEAVSSIEVVQAVTALCLWKEPDDDKPAFYFSRIIVLAKELDLGRNPPAAEVARMSHSEKRELRHRQRLWMALFSVSSIFLMQFRQPMLISYHDPLISTSMFWLKHALPEHLLMDTFITFSSDLRCRYMQYRELLNDSENPSALMLSTVTKTMNRELEVTSEAWIREIIDAGGTPAYVHKPRVWYSALALNLNLMILNQTLRIAPQERIPPAMPSLGPSSAVQLRSIPAFHHCLNLASTVLLRFHDLDKAQITFASDTLLHFALYAATFLWTLCRTPELYDFEAAEVEYTRDLILKVAVTLDDASPYPNSSPALHARYLRRLCRSRGQGSYSSSETPSGPVDTQSGLHRASALFDANAWAAGHPQPSGSHSFGADIDFFIGDFPWAGMELPWAAADGGLYNAASARALGGGASGAGVAEPGVSPTQSAHLTAASMAAAYPNGRG